MSKILFIIIAGLLSLPCSILAQRPNMQLGAYFGLNYSVINQKLEQIDPGVGAGVQGGFYIRVTKKQRFVELGMNFLRQITYLSISELDTLVAAENGIYVFSTEFPILVGVKPIKKPLIKWRIYTGMIPTFIGKVDDPNNLGYDKKQWTNPQIGWRLGSGADLAFFTLDFNYTFGLNKSLRRVFRTQSHMWMFNFGVLF